ncbi:MAG: hypothetical protein NPIRA01_13750 [Nitrospirales bacterium]|nr:MAG: hypothetical protein NPIRA01_13750 [Nitrospirales bacterium]
MESTFLQTYDSPIEGKGLVATTFIPAGTVLWTASSDYVELTLKELRQRPIEQQHLAYRCGKDRFILAFDDSQYMNHSCEPNTWWLGDEMTAARRDIQPGEEITYDYATSEAHPWWKEKWVCQCGANNCRGVLTGRDCLDPVFQERYRGHLPSWVLKFIEEQSGLRGTVTGCLANFVEVTRKVKHAWRSFRCHRER